MRFLSENLLQMTKLRKERTGWQLVGLEGWEWRDEGSGRELVGTPSLGGMRGRGGQGLALSQGLWIPPEQEQASGNAGGRGGGGRGHGVRSALQR